MFLASIGESFLTRRTSFLSERIRSGLADHEQCIKTSVPSCLITALVVAEDKRFWQHAGVDLLAIIRAGISVCLGGPLQGASTIDQQLVRTITGYRSLSLKRKLREMILACVIQRYLGKKEIATLYLCCAYYGWRMNSLQQACKRMGFSIGKLSLSESAVIVSLLKYPEPKVPSLKFQRLLANRSAHILNRVKSLSA
jgi:membrane carboxypeptidase/penicillin-binding protein